MAKLPQTSPWRSRAPNLPSIPTPSTEPRQLLRFMEAIKEAIEVREGGRASEHDRYVTFRDLADLGLQPSQLRVGAARPGDVRIALAGGGYASISVGEFETAIKGSRAYADLVKLLNDPTRFDALPALVREVLLSDLAAEARLRGADIQRLEKKIQDSTQSLAMSVETTTAALGSSLAAVRETTFASASEGQAVAGKVTQIIARLNDVDGEGVTIEEVLYGSATYAGLMGQWSLKINAGGAVAGILLAAEDSAAGPTSALLIQADKFAIVSPSYSGGPTNSPAANLIPFGVDSSGVYVNGQLRVNATGPTLDELATLGGIKLDYSSQYFKIDAAGAAVNASITLTAVLSSGLSGYVDWSSSSGYGGTLPAAGTANTATINVADLTADAAVFTITKVDGSDTYTDTVTLVKLRDGTDALSAVLTNEAHTVSAASTGAVSPWPTGVGGNFMVFRGATRLVSGVTYSIQANPDGLAASINASTGAYSITGAGSWADASNSTTLTLRATIGTTTIDKTFVLTKARRGVDGTDGTSATLLTLGASAQTFHFNTAGTASPITQIITFTATLQNLTGDATWTCALYNTAKAIIGTVTLGGTGNVRTLNVSQFGVAAYAEITASRSGRADTLTVVRLQDGLDGDDAVSALLTNEHVTVPANADGSSPVLTGATSSMRVYVGTVNDTANWTFTTSASPGVALSSGSATPDIVVSGLTVDSGTVTKTASKAGYSPISKVFTITKAKAGTSGANGDRGSLTAYTVNTSLQSYPTRTGGAAKWSIGSPSSSNGTLADNVARNRIWAILGNGGSAPSNAHLRIGDTVTITNHADPAAATVSVTGYWSGTAWLNPGVTIDGNLLVNGTISGEKIIAGTLAVDRLASGTWTENGVGSFRLGSTSLNPLINGLIQGVVPSGVARAAVSGVNDTVDFPAVAGLTLGTGFGIGGFAYSPTGTKRAQFVGGHVNYGGMAELLTAGKQVFLANASYSIYSPAGKGKHYIADGAGPFTGFHDGITRDTPEIGDICVDHAILGRVGVSNVSAEYRVSTAPNQRGVIGVCSEVFDEPPIGWEHVPAGARVIHVNALGEGMVNVCGEGGDLELGDLIVTSSRPGKGKRQADDLVRSTTVAKVREPVRFDGDEVRQVACVYLCG